MLVLKLPIIYLIAVVWWAVRAEPEPPEPALRPVAAEPEPEPDLDPSGRRRHARRPRRGGPHGRGGPTRRPDRVAVR